MSVRLYLVRPAHAERRSRWSGPGGNRPLTDEGRAQAEALASWLGRFPITALACGPSLRSRQTLEPLAQQLGLPILVDDRLDRDADPHEMAQRVAELGENGAVVCLSRTLAHCALRSLLDAGQVDFEMRYERGAVWMVEGSPARATYFASHRASRDRGRPLTNLEAIPLKQDTTKQGSRDESVLRASTPAEKQRVAVLDMGSTSFHLMVAEWTPDGELHRIARERVMLRMGSELAKSSSISPSLLDRSLEAVRDLCAFAEEHKAVRLVSVATAALREASNGPEVLAELESAIGGPVHLLSGEEEARVVYRAIRTRIDLGRKAHVGLDLGGGSLEIVVGRGEEILFEKTLPLGVARLHGALSPSEPHSKEDLKRLRYRVREEVEPLVEEIKACDPASCVAVGGTARALGRILVRDQGGNSSDLRGLRIERKQLAKLGKELAVLTIDERVERPGVSSRRADLIPFGAEILSSVLSLLGESSLVLCDWGLREGVLLDLLDAEQDEASEN